MVVVTGAGSESPFVSVGTAVVVSFVDCSFESPDVVVSPSGEPSVDSVPIPSAAGASAETSSASLAAGTDSASFEAGTTTACCASALVASVAESSATAVPAKAPKAQTATSAPR